MYKAVILLLWGYFTCSIWQRHWRTTSALMRWDPAKKTDVKNLSNKSLTHWRQAHTQKELNKVHKIQIKPLSCHGVTGSGLQGEANAFLIILREKKNWQLTVLLLCVCATCACVCMYNKVRMRARKREAGTVTDNEWLWRHLTFPLAPPSGQHFQLNTGSTKMYMKFMKWAYIHGPQKMNSVNLLNPAFILRYHQVKISTLHTRNLIMSY